MATKVRKQVELAPEIVAKLIQEHLRRETGEKNLMVVPSRMFVHVKDNTKIPEKYVVNWESKYGE